MSSTQHDICTDDIVLSTSNGITFIKRHDNSYRIVCSVANPTIMMDRLINFDIITLIHKLNSDIFEYVHTDILSDDRSTVFVLMKPFFADVGMTQKYSYFDIKKTSTFKDDDGLEPNSRQIVRQVFSITGITTHIPENIDVPPNCELIVAESAVITVSIVSPHEMSISTDICFDKTVAVESFVENIICNITSRGFSRVKQFIERV